MKICLITRFFDFRNAGLGRVSMEIRDRLLARGHEVCQISTGGESLASYFVYTVRNLAMGIPPGYDVYHALTPMEAMYIPSAKGVTTFHDLILLTHPDRAGAGVGYNSLKLLAARFLFGHMSRVATMSKVIVCDSEQTRDDVVRCLGVAKEKLKVIRLGICDDLEPKPKPDNVFRIGYLGQLDRRKRVNLLIQAFKESGMDGELVIGGIGVDESRLRALADGDSRIRFLGLVPDDQLVDFYNSLDLFVFPSGIEGYGLPIVEAMACRKPVVLLDDAIVPTELWKRCYATGDLSQQLSYADRCLDWGVDLEDNYTFAKSHSWDRCVDEYEAIYKETQGN